LFETGARKRLLSMLSPPSPANANIHMQGSSIPLKQYIFQAGEISVQLVPAREASSYLQAWSALASRALEANIFAEPDIVLSGAQHLEEGKHVAIMFVWRGIPGMSGHLRGVLPLVMPRWPLISGGARLWRPLLSPNGLPLIDKDQPEETLKAAFDALALRGVRMQELQFSGLDPQGPLSQAILSVARRTGRLASYQSAEARPALMSQDMGEAGLSQRIDLAQASELRNIRKDLAYNVDLQFERACTSRAVRDAVEEFLTLEASGPLGKTGQSLIDSINSSGFVRAMTRRLAKSRQCRIDMMRIDGHLAAAAIVLETGDRAWVWRMTSNENYEAIQPELQLILDMAIDPLKNRFEKSRPTITEFCCDGDQKRYGGLLRTIIPTAMIAIATRPDLAQPRWRGRIAQTVRKAAFAARKSLTPRPVIAVQRAGE
jgi:CelD/BcsL family acetyltransferase involved in cellulose biosynthesis